MNTSVTVQTVNLNSIRVKIAGQFNIALIDTGCGTSIISHKFLRKNKLDMKHLKKGKILLYLRRMGVKFEFWDKQQFC